MRLFSIGTAVPLALLAATFIAIPGQAAQLVWNGVGPGSQDNDWDLLTNGPRNWLSEGASAQFQSDNDLLFGDIAPLRSQVLNYTIDVGGLSGGNLTARSITIESTNTYTFNQSSFFGTSIVTDTLRVNSPLELNATNVFQNTFVAASSGIVVSSGGSLALGGLGDRIADTTSITLDGGQLSFGVAGGTETVGALTLTGDSVLNLSGAGSGLSFTSPSDSFNPGTFTLSVWNWDGADSLGFSSQLSDAELAQIVFYSDAGLTRLAGAGYTPAGRIAPIPEPSALACLLAAGITMLSARLRRRCQLAV